MQELAYPDVPFDSAVESLKTLPFSREAEQSVLGGLMLSNEAWVSIASLLTETDFYLREHQILFRAIKSLSEESNPCDPVTLSEWLQGHNLLNAIGGGAYLGLLAGNTPSAANIVAYAEIVRERSILRQLVRVGTTITDSAFNTQGRTSAQLLDNAEKMVFEIAELGARGQGGFVKIDKILTETLTRMDILSQQEGTITGLSTNFADFDKLTSGLQRSDLIIVAGRPSMGKTSFAMNIAEYVAVEKQLPVAVFSMEMSDEQLAMRLISSLAGVNLQNVRTGKLNDGEWAKITDAISRLELAPLFIDQTPALNPTELRAKVRRLAREQGQLGLVVVDYLQLMQVLDNKENRATEVSEISRSLKSLAKELNVPVMALSQLNRSLEQRSDRRPKMSDLRESGCLAGNTLVICADTGMQVPIRDLVGRNDFTVWGLNTQTMQLERAQVSRAFCTGIKPVFRLTTRLGRTIRATGNHKLYTIDGWKRLDELKKDDYLALPRRIPAPKTITPKTDAELALLGHLIGDGCTLPRHAIQYTTGEKDLAELVAQLAVEVFGSFVAPRINAERNWFQVYLTSTRQHTHGVRSVISEWLDRLGIWGLRSYEKRVPRPVFRQSNEGIATFLRHLWVTDGCIRPNKIHPTVYYATSSQLLALDIQSLLLRLGINARVKTVPQPNKGRDQHHVILKGQTDILRFADLVGTVGEYKTKSLAQVRDFFIGRFAISKRDVIPNSLWKKTAQLAWQQLGMTGAKFCQQVGLFNSSGRVIVTHNLTRERALRVANVLQSDELKKMAQSDIYWDRIAAIEPAGEEEVFDLTVPTVHNFIANNLTIKNSIEQDSDLIAFIYRDEVYNENSPNKGIAEIIIAKQRNGPIGTILLTFRGNSTKFENHISNDHYFGE